MSPGSSSTSTGTSRSPRVPASPALPERIDGMTVGIQRITEDSPHDGEMHPDGDEILHVIRGGFV